MIFNFGKHLIQFNQHAVSYGKPGFAIGFPYWIVAAVVLVGIFLVV